MNSCRFLLTLIACVSHGCPHPLKKISNAVMALDNAEQKVLSEQRKQVSSGELYWERQTRKVERLLEHVLELANEKLS